MLLIICPYPGSGLTVSWVLLVVLVLGSLAALVLTALYLQTLHEKRAEQVTNILLLYSILKTIWLSYPIWLDHITFSKVLPHYFFRLNRPERDSLKL